MSCIPPKMEQIQQVMNDNVTNIKIHIRNIENLPNKYFFRDTGRVNIDLSVCSVYSRPNRYDTIMQKRNTASTAFIYIFKFVRYELKRRTLSEFKACM